MKGDTKSTSWIGTFSYGQLQFCLQKLLRQQNTKLNNIDHRPWLLLRDLSEITNSSEKLSTYQKKSTRYINSITLIIKRVLLISVIHDFFIYGITKN